LLRVSLSNGLFAQGQPSIRALLKVPFWQKVDRVRISYEAFAQSQSVLRVLLKVSLLEGLCSRSVSFKGFTEGPLWVLDPMGY